MGSFMEPNFFPKKGQNFKKNLRNSMLIALEWLYIDWFWRLLIRFTFKTPIKRIFFQKNWEKILKTFNPIPPRDHFYCFFYKQIFWKTLFFQNLTAFSVKNVEFYGSKKSALWSFIPPLLGWVPPPIYHWSLLWNYFTFFIPRRF